MHNVFIVLLLKMSMNVFPGLVEFNFITAGLLQQTNNKADNTPVFLVLSVYWLNATEICRLWHTTTGYTN